MEKIEIIKNIIKPGYAYRNFGTKENKRDLIRFISYGVLEIDIEKRVEYSYDNIHFAFDRDDAYSHSNGMEDMYAYVDFLQTLKHNELVIINEKEYLEKIISNLQNEIKEKEDVIKLHREKLLTIK